jgi:hypothetical protein
MKNKYLSLLFFLLLACEGNKNHQPPSIMLTANSSYMSPEGNFEIFFPHKPLISSLEGQVKGQKVINYVFVYDNGKEKYAVNYADYPDGSGIDLEEIKQKGLQSMGEVSMKEEKQVSLGNYQGLQYQAQIKNGIAKASVAGKIYLAGRRVYHISVFTNKELPENTQTFLDSFVITK